MDQSKLEGGGEGGERAWAGFPVDNCNNTKYSPEREPTSEAKHKIKFRKVMINLTMLFIIQQKDIKTGKICTIFS